MYWCKHEMDHRLLLILLSLIMLVIIIAMNHDQSLIFTHQSSIIVVITTIVQSSNQTYHPIIQSSNHPTNQPSASPSLRWGGRNPAPPLQPYICQCITCTPVPPSSMSNDMLTGGAGFPSLAQTHFDTVPSNNIKLGAGGFKCRPLKVVQDFFHPQ